MPVLQFAVSGLLATLVIGLIGVAVLRHIGTREAVRDAKQVTRLAGEGIVAPVMSPAAVRGDPAALRRVDAVVRRRVLGDDVVRVKVWAPDGRIVYSDEPRLIGARYPLDPEDQRAFSAHGVAAEVSDLGRPENRYERGAGKLLEVYLPIQGENGQPLLFEAYQRFGSVSASGRRLWLAFLPALLGGLLLLQLINLPLARSLAGRLRRGQREREALLEEALDASQTERRTIAGDLHDGVVQDLVGLSYNLAAHAQRLDGADPDAAAALREGAATTRESVRALRTLLVDIYPPSLHRAGLAAALDDLARTYTARGLATTVDVEDCVRPPEETERLVFRVVQEALRNTQKHAHATRAVVTVRQGEAGVVLEAEDDGRGFDDAGMASGSGDGDRDGDAARPGHFGFRLLRDRAEAAGGHLQITSRAGQGTLVRMELPA
ncbi:MAG TPA: ATP-binding protein [Baekduia sp.]